MVQLAGRTVLPEQAVRVPVNLVGAGTFQEGKRAVTEQTIKVLLNSSVTRKELTLLVREALEI